MNCLFCNHKMQSYPVGKHGFQKIRCPGCKTIILRSPQAIATTDLELLFNRAQKTPVKSTT